MGLSSIEQCFERIATALEHIAIALQRPEGPTGEHAQPILKAVLERSVTGEVEAQLVTENSIPVATYEQAQSAIMGLIGAQGHDAAKKLLAEFKAKFVKDLTTEQYGTVVKRVQELIA